MSSSSNIQNQDSAKPHLKRKKSYYLTVNKKNKCNKLEAGLKGFMITYNKQEKWCTREAYQLLNEYADKLYLDQSHKSKEQNNEDLEEALAKEIAELNDKKSRFQKVLTSCKNILFIKVDDSIDPFKLSQYIFENIKENKKFITRRVLRILPVEITCKYQIEAISRTFEEIIVNQSLEASTFKIEVKIRNNNDISKNVIIDNLVEIIKTKRQNWKVNFEDPNITIIVYVLNKICCLSFLKNFSYFKKYNPNEFSFFINRTNQSNLNCKNEQSKIF